ncbi:MAG: hypothetical protein FWF44_08040 [Defluviitaleaceae bacterium]|nr:hypothetical protein [Defluviitaleaceae bacterium]
MKQVMARNCGDAELCGNAPTDDNFLRVDNSDLLIVKGPRFRFPDCDVYVVYGDEPALRDNTPKELKIIIRSRFKVRESLNLKWYADPDFLISPSREGKMIIDCWSARELTFEVSRERVQKENRLVLEITVDGKHNVMTAPAFFMNGNITGIDL